MQNIENLLVAVFCFSIPLGTRIVLWQFGTSFFPYNTLFLYAADISALALIVFWLYLEKASGLASLNPVRSSRGALNPVFAKIGEHSSPQQAAGHSVSNGVKNFTALAIGVFLAIGIFSALQSRNPELGITTVARLALFAFFSFLLARRIPVIPQAAFLIPLFLGGVLQSGLAWFQFLSGYDAGLWFLGEPALGTDIAGIAKLEALGTTFIRAYGTLPHPNMLAAFLILTIFFSSYAYIRESRKSLRANMLWLGGTALMLTALLFTFSRTGWLAFGIGLGIAGVWTITKKSTLTSEGIKKVYALCIVFLSAALFAWLYFPNAIQSRGTLALEDQAVQMRLEGTYQAAKMLDVNKLFGVGPGQFVQNIERYAGTLPELWMYQPVHNTYLLIASEFGLLGLIAFLFFIGFALRAWLNSRNLQQFLFRPVALAVFVSFLLLGLFDHYFFTFEQGLALFWVSAALLQNHRG